MPSTTAFSMRACISGGGARLEQQVGHKQQADPAGNTVTG